MLLTVHSSNGLKSACVFKFPSFDKTLGLQAAFFASYNISCTSNWYVMLFPAIKAPAIELNESSSTRSLFLVEKVASKK